RNLSSKPHRAGPAMEHPRQSSGYHTGWHMYDQVEIAGERPASKIVNLCVEGEENDASGSITSPPGEGAVFKSLIYGAVNALLAIPCFYGYASIIFRHPVYSSFMPALAKLILFSSMVHQTMFGLLSSLPFAIGQVQDSGLIFLA
ncbi:unnamed protein product, partial [Discosporangium mesarthrocarpum]